MAHNTLTQEDGMAAAVRLAVIRAGGPTKVSQCFGIHRAAVAQWPKAPLDRVIELERMSGVSRHLLRPDIYGEYPTVPPLTVLPQETPSDADAKA